MAQDIKNYIGWQVAVIKIVQGMDNSSPEIGLLAGGKGGFSLYFGQNLYWWDNFRKPLIFIKLMMIKV